LKESLDRSEMCHAKSGDVELSWGVFVSAEIVAKPGA
jgi:hypothetical protein